MTPITEKAIAAVRRMSTAGRLSYEKCAESFMMIVCDEVFLFLNEICTSTRDRRNRYKYLSPIPAKTGYGYETKCKKWLCCRNQLYSCCCLENDDTVCFLCF